MNVDVIPGINTVVLSGTVAGVVVNRMEVVVVLGGTSGQNSEVQYTAIPSGFSSHCPASTQDLQSLSAYLGIPTQPTSIDATKNHLVQMRKT